MPIDERSAMIEAAARRFERELADVRASGACPGCECLHYVTGAGAEALLESDVPVAREVGRELAASVAASGRPTHGCLGCETCLPVEPHNRLLASLATAAEPPSAS